LDDVRIYNRALSREEIKAIMEGKGGIGMDIAPGGKLSLTWGRLKVM